MCAKIVCFCNTECKFIVRFMLNYRVKTVLINKKVKLEASCIIKVGSDYLLGFGNYNVILENCTELSAIFVKKCTKLSALSLFIRIFAAKEQHNRA